MYVMITDIEDYFIKGCGRCDRFDTPDCSTTRWMQGLSDLRTLCLDVGLDETVKWGHPCYMHAGRNIAIVGLFRGDFRISFFDAALMKDPEGVLEKQGPNTQHADMIRFTDNVQVMKRASVIQAYLQEAMGYARDGIRAPKNTDVPELPEELVTALDADAKLAEAFQALTPGRQKSYVINLGGAKKAETRIARIVKFRDKIIAGKGAMER
ncbi:YdeI/OmpD-associated family protein [Yoonia sp. 2307UL14-13]|uniref:YdeI/OmpD-associated family protein n=1 Tax=Yoonia sp. 2307UL14-13 TaxID=3126506 RepID=UPI0030AE305A